MQKQMGGQREVLGERSLSTTGAKGLGSRQRRLEQLIGTRLWRNWHVLIRGVSVTPGKAGETGGYERVVPCSDVFLPVTRA